MVNGYIAMAFDELATLLELGGESQFKTRAYRTFADTVRGLSEPLSQIDARGELEEMPGVGKAIASKVRELLRGGSMGALERARDAVPPQLPDLLRVAGLGPGRVRKLWQELGVTSLQSLVDACHDGRVSQLSGFGPKLVTKLTADAERALADTSSILLADALGIASALMTHLHDCLPSLLPSKIRAAGAARRGHELVDEVLLVAGGVAPSEVVAAFNASTCPLPLEILEANGPFVVARRAGGSGPRVRVRCTTARGFVHSLLTETGDADHVRTLEAKAVAAGSTLSAICDGLPDEEAAYAALNLATVPPELREGSGLDVPRDLLPVRGVHGIFHVHTTWSDGVASVTDMARAAAEAGYSYVGISDHSRAASYANGLDTDRLRKQREDVERARIALPQIVILHGIEVDVMADGTLDLPDDVLAELDFVVASLHTGFQLDIDAQTKRIVRALSHPLVTLLGHPTGRLLLGRPGYTFHVDEVARAAAAGGACLEINASPNRLDLSPDLIRRAAALGAHFCINPDAHEPRGFGDVPLGISQARRAGLRTDQVLNTLDPVAIVAALRARRSAGMQKLRLH